MFPPTYLDCTFYFIPFSGLRMIFCSVCVLRETQAGLRLWRASNTAISSAATRAATTLAAPNEPSSSSSSSSSGHGAGNISGSGDGAVSAPTATASPAATMATADTPAQPPPLRSSNNGRGDNGAGSSAGRENSSPREGSPLLSTPRAAAGAQGGEPYTRSSEVAVAGGEAAVWAAVDKAAAFHYSTWVLLMAMLPLIYRLLW